MALKDGLSSSGAFEPFLYSCPSSRLALCDCVCTSCTGWDVVSRDDLRHPTSFDEEFLLSASSSISLFASASLRFDWHKVRLVSTSEAV